MQFKVVYSSQAQTVNQIKKERKRKESWPLVPHHQTSIFLKSSFMPVLNLTHLGKSGHYIWESEQVPISLSEPVGGAVLRLRMGGVRMFSHRDVVSRTN